MIAIDMEKPKACKYCPFMIEFIGLECLITHAKVEDSPNGIYDVHKDCPLIEIESKATPVRVAERNDQDESRIY